MNLVGKKNKLPTQRKKFTDANLRKQQNTQVYHVSTYKILHQGNGVFKTKAKTVTSGQRVDNNY